MQNIELLNPQTVKDSLTTRLKELQERYVVLCLELRTAERKLSSDFPEAREQAAVEVIQKKQESEAHEFAMDEVRAMISEL